MGTILTANSKVLRVLVDIGNSADILFKKALKQLRIGGAQMLHVKTPLYGFVGDCLYTKGTITLPTTFGEAPTQMTRIVEFLVGYKLSAYNAIIEHPTLNAHHAVIYTYHVVMKFLTEFGVGVIRGSQVTTRECYTMTMSPKLVGPRYDVSTIFMPS